MLITADVTLSALSTDAHQCGKAAIERLHCKSVMEVEQPQRSPAAIAHIHGRMRTAETPE